MKKVYLKYFLICLYTLLSAHIAYASTVKELNFAIAASLKPVFEEKIIPIYKEENKNINIMGIYDSSGRLEMQIKEGLDVDLFFSAAPLHIERLIQLNTIEKDTIKAVLTNKLVLIQNTKNAQKDNSLKDYNNIKNVHILAIGNPKSAPIGTYTKEALEALNIWHYVENKLSLAQNVTEILYWVAQGSAEAGIVYASDAKKAKNITIVSEIPFNNEDIKYIVAPIKSSNYYKELDNFMEFLLSDKVQKIFVDYGFMTL